MSEQKILADLDDIGLAIHDAIVCGTGVMKFWFDDGQISIDHVPIKDFQKFGEELQWRASKVTEEKKQ